MITKLSLGLMFVLLVACEDTGNRRVNPVFNAGGGISEAAPEIPCPLEKSNDWHRCHRSNACCPNGYSCGEDDFVPRAGVCRWLGWGRE